MILGNWLVSAPLPVPPTVSSRVNSCSKLSIPARSHAAQMLTSLATLPIQVNCAGSKRASSGLADQRLERRAAIDRADHRAVLRRDVVEIVRQREAARALHVGRHEPRIAGNVLAHVACQHARIDVIRAARTEADQHLDRLAAIEILRRLPLFGRTRRERQNAKRENNSSETSDHCSPAGPYCRNYRRRPWPA